VFITPVRDLIVSPPCRGSVGWQWRDGATTLWMTAQSVAGTTQRDQQRRVYPIRSTARTAEIGQRSQPDAFKPMRRTSALVGCFAVALNHLQAPVPRGAGDVAVRRTSFLRCDDETDPSGVPRIA
jgi:hypothetical protein